MGELPVGTCTVIRRYGPRVSYEEWWFEIGNADPHILISDEVLRDMFIHIGMGEQWKHTERGPYSHTTLDMGPAMRMSPLDPNACAVWHLGPCFTGAVLTLAGRNRTVVYRIGQYEPGSSWHAYWPD